MREQYINTKQGRHCAGEKQRWSETMERHWSRWAGHAARLAQNRVAGMTAVLNGGVVAQSRQGSLVPGGRAQRWTPKSKTQKAGQRRWNEVVRRAVDGCLGGELLRHEVAEDRDMWQHMGAEFMRRVLRRQAVSEALGRWFMSRSATTNS